jgi:hypothetical protein
MLTRCQEKNELGNGPLCVDYLLKGFMEGAELLAARQEFRIRSGASWPWEP